MQLRHADPRHATVIADFVRKIVAARLVWTVAGAEGLARAPSPTRDGRETTLFWTDQTDAELAAATVASEPRVKGIPLADILNEVLPKLHQLERAVGPSWIAEPPCQPEIEPTELAERLCAEMVASFVRQAVSHGSVYILEDDQGPAFAASAANVDNRVLPVWPVQPDAEFPRNGFLQDAAVSRIPLDAFMERTLVWLEEIGRAAAPSPSPLIAGIELTPADLAGRIKRVQRLAAHV